MTAVGRWLLLLGLTAGVAGASESTPAPITLEAALRLAGARSLAVEIGRERVAEARALRDAERQALLPWIAPGLGYRRHDGNLQDIVGDVFNASKQAGNAVVSVQAQVEVGEALYRVLAARQGVEAAGAEAEVRRRGMWTATALAYTELCRAAAAVANADEALRISGETLRQVRAAAGTGLAFAGDVRRVEVQQGRNQTGRLEAVLAERVASARLAQLLRLPPDVPLVPDLSELVPVVLVPADRPLDSLTASALARRPELLGADAAVAGARVRQDAARRAPWIPTVSAQAGFGGLAGGRNGQFRNGDDYQDYVLGLGWRIGPGGIGDGARSRTAAAGLRIAELERETRRDEVGREVVELRARAAAAADRVELAMANVVAARDLLGLARSRKEFGVGAVLELIEAERELSRTLSEHLEAVARHNRCQWEFWHATGEDLPGGQPGEVR